MRRFNGSDGDYIFIRNLHETRRMIYSLYNAMGENDWIMQTGSPRMRGDGTPWVPVHPPPPDDMISAPFGPGRRKRFPKRCTPAQAAATAWKSGMYSKRQISENRIQPTLMVSAKYRTVRHQAHRFPSTKF